MLSEHLARYRLLWVALGCGLALWSGMTVVPSSTSFRSTQQGMRQVKGMPEDTLTGIEAIEEEAELKREQEQDQHPVEQSHASKLPDNNSVNKNNAHQDDDKVTFVFAIGLEGSGHHALKALFPKSPAYHRKKDMGLGDLTKELRSQLSPLWFGACDFEHDTNGQEAFSNLAQTFQKMRHEIGDIDQPLTVMLNAGEGGNMISYPTKLGKCRPYAYLELDSLYTACDMAGVRCGHVYLYRDPYDAVHSAQRRGYNPTVEVAVKLYYSMLGVILSQLYAYPERTLGCWNLFDNDAKPAEREDSIRRLFGWFDDTAGFEETFIDTIHEHDPLTPAELEELIPPTLQIFMDAMVRAHNRVVDLCRDSAAANGYV